MMVNKIVRKKYRREPPDGGWSYFIVLGMVLLFTCVWGNQGTFSFIFNDFLKKSGKESSALTIITGTYSSALSFACLFASVLFKKYSMRIIGILGSLLYFVGCIATAFATSIQQLIISYGILQAFGFGMMVSVAYTTFNSYFVKRRAVMMHSTKAIVGLTTMFFPIFVEYLMKEYGLHGSLAIIAAINGHVIFAMLVMHPVEWHCKLVEISVDETNTFMSSSSNAVAIKSIPEEEYELNERAPNEFLNTSTKEKPIKKGKWQKFVDFLDLTLLKDLIYVNIVIGITFASISDSSFFSLQPMYLSELEYSKAETAQIISIGSAADLFCRVLLSLVALYIHIKARYIFLIGAIVTIIFRFVIINTTNFMGMAVITAVLNIFHTLMHSPLPVIFGEYLPQDRFASGYGLFLFIQGNLTFLIGPIVGWIRDTSQSYIICFHSLSILMSFCIISWLFEFTWLRFYSKKGEN